MNFTEGVRNLPFCHNFDRGIIVAYSKPPTRKKVYCHFDIIELLNCCIVVLLYSF
jgi:hypothetical protein